MNASLDLTADEGDDLCEITTFAGALRYYDIGSGPVLLFLHGSGPGVTGWRNFRGVLPTFAAQFRCLVLEFPGFGVSDDFGGHPMITAQAYTVLHEAVSRRLLPRGAPPEHLKGLLRHFW